jgi:hypothetical protein
VNRLLTKRKKDVMLELALEVDNNQ